VSFLTRGISVCEDLSNAVTVDNLLGIDQLRRSGVAFSRERGNQLWRLHDVEDAPEIVDERGQAELAANLLQPSHQKRTLVHPLLYRAKRVFDRLAALVENVWPLRYAGLHSIQYGLVLETGY
jgi:hypothetical protein